MLAMVIAASTQRCKFIRNPNEEIINSPFQRTRRDTGLSVIESEVLFNNHKMLKLMTSLCFAIRPSEDDPGIVKVSKPL